MRGFRVIVCAALGGLFLLLSSGCQGTPKEKPAAASDPEQVIGSLRWEITETATGKILGEGRREILLKEVAVTGGDLTIKQIPLSDHFVLGMAESSSPTKAEKKGFGLTLRRDDAEKLFSWDWFTVNYEDHAYKLQEEGSLRIKIGNAGSGWEVTRTEFLSDVSLRAFIVGEKLTDRPKWRVRIFKGSLVRWPSLVNGIVVAGD